jgi:acyl-CoA thioesterase
MDATEFLGLCATHNPVRWYLEVVPGICTDDQFLFGGCGLGAAIEALERTTGRRAVWAAAQYLSFAHPPDIMDIDVTVARAGQQTTQARAVAHVGDREILAVSAALGQRDTMYDGQWARFPDVPAPEDCPPRQRISRVDDSLAQRLEMRLARGRDLSALDGVRDDGHSALWARFPAGLDVSAAALAILGDYVPFGVAQALGKPVTGSSLDNTLRVCSLVRTEWVLIDVRVHAVAHGFGHGRVELWAEDGTLLATASQSCVVRPRTGRPRGR